MVRAHLALPVLSSDDLDRLIWPYVDCRASHECWPWQRGLGGANRTAHGYAVRYVGKRQYRVSRLLYRALVGEIPAGQFILHSCDFPPCCNPAHLRIGTQSDNMRDRTARGRHPVETTRANIKLAIVASARARTSPDYVRTERQRRADQGMRRLSVEQVEEIQRRHTAGEQQNRLAQEFGVSKQVLNRIVLRKEGYR